MLMGDSSYDLGNGLTIDADNPDRHDKPTLCKKCRVIYYFGGHYCVNENQPSKAFKRAIQGYYDGE